MAVKKIQLFVYFCINAFILQLQLQLHAFIINYIYTTIFILSSHTPKQKEAYIVPQCGENPCSRGQIYWTLLIQINLQEQESVTNDTKPWRQGRLRRSSYSAGCNNGPSPVPGSITIPLLACPPPIPRRTSTLWHCYRVKFKCDWFGLWISEVVNLSVPQRR